MYTLFTKENLKDGMLVETADGEVYIVLNGFLRNSYRAINISYYDKELFNGTNGSEIVRVFKGDDFLSFDTKGRPVIWERTEDPLTVLHRAVDTYGETSQVDMAIEEMSELTKALLKHRRGKKSSETWDANKTRAAIIEEMADVYIMLRQLMMLYDKDNEVNEQADLKVERLRKRLAKREENLDESENTTTK